mgnify:FL=1
MYTHIFFDLDGTLTDPKEGITNSVAYALASFGIHEDPDRLTPFIGPPLIDSFMEFYHFDLPTAQKAVEIYREYFSQKGIFENKVFSGTQPLLAQLKAAGKTVCLATSKPEVFARQILEHFHIDGYFDQIVGSCLDGTRTKKGEVIEEVFARLGEKGPDKAMCVMMGDRLHDIHGAQENDLDSIGVTFGYGSQEELTQAGATHIAHSFEELAQILG